MKGHVANLVLTKNFGFIMSGGTEYFFHRDDFNGHWMDLEKDFASKKRGATIEVTFDEAQSTKGPRAANVSRLDFPNQSVREE